MDKNSLKTLLTLFVTSLLMLILATTSYSRTSFGKEVSGGNMATFLIQHGRDISNSADELSQGFVSNPISIYNGNKYEQQTDIVLPSPRKDGFSFSRSYNSQSDQSSTLGYGWTHSYNIKLDPNKEIAGTIYIHIKDQTGRGYYFSDSGADRWDGVYGETSHVMVEGGGYTWYKENGSSIHFTSTGLLEWHDDNLDNRQTFTYVADKLSTITDVASNRILIFNYTSDLLSTVTGSASAAAPNGILVTYGYDASNNLTSAVYADGSGFNYEYTDLNDIHNLTAKKSTENYTITTWGYDAQDRANQSFTRYGEGVDIKYVDDTHIEVTDAYGHTRTYTLAVQNGREKIESISGPGGCASCTGSDLPIRYAYDTEFRKIEEEYANGTINIFGSFTEHDDPQVVTYAVGTPEERIINYTYHPELGSKLTQIEDSVINPGNSKETIWDYDDPADPSDTATPNENPTRLLYRFIEKGYTWDADKNIITHEEITTFTYNSKGQILTVDGPKTGNVDTTTYSYDPITGDLLTITNSLVGTTILSDYDAAGNPGAINDINGQQTTLTYDARNRLLSRTTNGVTESLSYTTGGDLLTATDGSGVMSGFSYDATYGRLQQILDPLGNYLSFDYDTQGNRIENSIYDLTDTRRHYLRSNYQEPDVPGRLWKTINPDDTETIFTYDAAGNVESVTDALNKITNYAYDSLNRLTQVTQPGPAVTAYSYDSNNNITSVTDAENKITTYIYDDFGNVLSTTSPDTGETTYQYDETGNLLSSTDANGTTLTYFYDALNRLTGLSYPDPSENVTYDYDQGENGMGRLTSITDQSGSTNYIYDQLGRLETETKIISGQTFTTTYGYDGANRLVSVTYPSGRVLTFDRGLDGQVTNVTTTYDSQTEPVAESIFHLPFGPIQTMDLANSQAVTNTYDLLYRLSSSQVGSIYNRGYGFDLAGNVETISDLINPAASQNFTFDSLYRLETATGLYGSIGYTYDKVGNRQTRTINSQVDTYSYLPNTNKLSAISGTNPVSFDYDPGGNATDKNTSQFIYNQNNRLIQALNDGTTAGEYTYNAMGQRVKKVENDITTLSIFDQSGNLIAEADETGRVMAEYAYLDGQLLTKFVYNYEQPSDITVTVKTSSDTPLSSVKVYGFTEQGSYTGIHTTTNEQGQAVFAVSDFADGYYKFRADYLGIQFWTDVVSVPGDYDVNLTIAEEQVSATVLVAGEAKEGVRVYLFGENGSYLGVYGYTDENGQVFFDLPAGYTFKFRADYFGHQYWSTHFVEQGGANQPIINTGGGDLTITVQESAGQPIAGLKTYLFTESGSYLGQSGITDANGQSVFTVSGGNYQIRGDYLGYQFWSDLGQVSGDTHLILEIPHQQVTVSVSGDHNGDSQPRSAVKTYLFSSAGAYLGKSQTTDQNGQAIYSVPEMAYKVRADYQLQQFWSDPFTWTNPDITIAEGVAEVLVTNMGQPLSGVRTYAFNGSGSYLGLYNDSDINGKASYRLPQGNYNFRADYMGSQYWSDVTTLIPHVVNSISVSTGGGEILFTLSKGFDDPMAGVKTYLFSDTGSYLGDYQVTNDQGQASYALADGDYSLRIDYLGNQFWTENFTIPTDDTLDFVMPHQDIALTVQGDYNGTIELLPGVKTYLFSPAGSYLNKYQITESNGQALYNLPAVDFKFRADYLSKQYWSDTVNWTDTTLTIEQGVAAVQVSQGSTSLAGVKVYVFSELGSYLGLNGTTDSAGSFDFTLPADTYQFRADYLGSQYWATATVAAHQSNPVAISTGGGSFVLTVNKGGAEPLTNVPVYVFNDAGSYLSKNARTDELGQVVFDLADGSYKYRADYLGYQFWTNVSTIPATLSDNLTIAHSDATITVQADDGTSITPLSNVKTYLFKGSGTYLGQSQTTDSLGQVTYSTPDQEYKVRADYLGSQYWSDLLIPGSNTVSINHGQVQLNILYAGEVVVNAPVYLFSATGSYLSRNERTDINGQANFTLPEKTFKFRVDYNGAQYWTNEINVLPHDLTTVDLSLDQLALNLTNDPHPLRYDGVPPEYKEENIKVASLGSLTGLLGGASVSVSQVDTYYYINDHLGTPQVITDATGAVVWQGDYEPFGKVNATVGTINNRFRFPGQYFDQETGLHYNWHRYYDPRTGRYLTPDPIGLAGGMNLYAYAFQNPVNWIDPRGLFNKKQFFSASWGLVKSGAGTAASLGGMATGAIMFSVPEPLTSVGGAFLFSASSYGYAKSSYSFWTNGLKLLGAFTDEKFNDSCSLEGAIANTYFDGDKNVKKALEAGGFALDLLTGKPNLINGVEAAESIYTSGKEIYNTLAP